MKTFESERIKNISRFCFFFLLIYVYLIWEISPVRTVGAEINRVVLWTILTVPPHSWNGFYATDVTLKIHRHDLRTQIYNHYYTAGFNDSILLCS